MVPVRMPQLRRVLGLRGVPDFSTLKKFSDRASTPDLEHEVWCEAFDKTMRFGKWSRRGQPTVSVYQSLLPRLPKIPDEGRSLPFWGRPTTT
jgi:hypothetical protein